MAYDRSLIVADPRRCEPKKFGGWSRALFEAAFDHSRVQVWQDVLHALASRSHIGEGSGGSRGDGISGCAEGKWEIIAGSSFCRLCLLCLCLSLHQFWLREHCCSMICVNVCVFFRSCWVK